MMTPSISKTFLHTGKDLKLGDNLFVKHPKIKDIVALNDGFFCEDIYLSYVQSILSDPYSYMVFLDDHGIDYETATPIDVLYYRWESPDERAVIQMALSFFMGNRQYQIGMINEKKIIYDPNDMSFVIGPMQFDWVTAFISKINCLSDDGKINPANASAKRILIEDMRDEIKKKLKKKKKDDSETNFIGDSITAVVYGSPSGVTPFNFEDLAIYQLLCGATSTQKQMRTQSILNGIHTGMVKADKLSPEDLRWT